MKQMNIRICTAAFALAVFAATLHGPARVALAQQEPALSVAVLDFEYVFRKSKAGSGLISTVTASQKKLDEEAKATGKKFHEDQKQLATDCQGGKFSQSECKTKQDKLIADIKVAEDSLNDRRKDLDKRLTDGKNKLIKALEPIVKKMIDEKKLTLVVDRAAVVYADPKYDLTKDALQALDANLQKL
jgi:Skp family chaperone for outer membrane proteins